MSIDLVKDWIVHTDSTTADLFDGKRYDLPLYVIDGVPFFSGTSDMDSLLSPRDFTQDQVNISFLNPKSENYEGTFFHRNSLIILITTNSEHPNGRKKKLTLAACLEMFKTPTLKAAHGQMFDIAPLVLVNGGPFDRTGSYEFLQRLTHHDISHIDILDQTPTSFLGRDSSHGIIRIWLK